MIFVLAKDQPVLFVMLTEADAQSMREGRTQFVDNRQLGNKTFNRVIISLHKNKQEILASLRQAGHYVDENLFTSVMPEEATEGRCEACDGCIAKYLLFEGKCTVCWATLAKKLQEGLTGKA